MKFYFLHRISSVSLIFHLLLIGTCVFVSVYCHQYQHNRRCCSLSSCLGISLCPFLSHLIHSTFSLSFSHSLIHTHKHNPHTLYFILSVRLLRSNEYSCNVLCCRARWMHLLFSGLKKPVCARTHMASKAHIALSTASNGNFAHSRAFYFIEFFRFDSLLLSVCCSVSV